MDNALRKQWMAFARECHATHWFMCHCGGRTPMAEADEFVECERCTSRWAKRRDGNWACFDPYEGD